MKQIDTLTSDARQSFQVPLDEGGTIYFNLYFYITQKSWFFDFTYGDYTCTGSRVVLTPNAIRHLKNILPFGIAFMDEHNIEPYSLQDFSSGRIKMYILNQDEVYEVEDEVYNVR